MFSFRTTSIFEQEDNVLSKGRLAVLHHPSAWYPEIDAYLHEIVASKWNVVKVYNIDQEKVTSASLAECQADALIIEAQTTGDRFDTVLWYMIDLFRDLKASGSEVSVYILDRFNPCLRQVEGVHLDGIPHKYGLTLAEAAAMAYEEFDLHFPLHVVSAYATSAGRDLMPWSIPLDNGYASFFSSYLHCGQYLWNGTNISAGQGTSRPYEFFGAPFLGSLRSVEAAYNKGVYMRRAAFTPAAGLYAGERCFGFQLLPNPSQPYNSYVHAIRLIRWIADSCEQFCLNDSISDLIGDNVVMAYIEGDASWEGVRDYIKTEEQKWLRKARKYLLYDEPLSRVKS